MLIKRKGIMNQIEEKYHKIIKICKAKVNLENDAGVLARDILAMCKQHDKLARKNFDEWYKSELDSLEASELDLQDF